MVTDIQLLPGTCVTFITVCAVWIHQIVCKHRLSAAHGIYFDSVAMVAFSYIFCHTQHLFIFLKTLIVLSMLLCWQKQLLGVNVKPGSSRAKYYFWKHIYQFCLFNLLVVWLFSPPNWACLWACGLVLAGRTHCVYQCLFADNECQLLLEIEWITVMTLNDTVNVWAVIEYNETQLQSSPVFLWAFVTTSDHFKLQVHFDLDHHH